MMCLEARQFLFVWSVSILSACRCACGMQYGGRVAPPSYVLHSAVPWGCV